MSTSWEDNLFAALQANASLTAFIKDRVYPSLAPTGVDAPYVVWHEVSTLSETEQDGPSNVDHPLVQFTVWDTDRNRARDVRKILRDLLEGKTLAGDFSVAATFSNQMFIFEAATRLHGALLELRFHTIPNPGS